MLEFLKRKAPPTGQQNSVTLDNIVDDQAHTKDEPVTILHRLSTPDSATEAEMEAKADVIANAAEEDEEVVYPTGLKIVGIIVGLCCAVFLVALDQTIIATASM